ncbi:DUF6221 family protein [Streptomyces cyaneofuscatus]|uniref:DUF6221 family protein n=1 Tax=Streptomyces cyaneofuscatus TaxID=66883 RepID=UPI003699AF9C
MTDALVAFLKARLEDDERVARAAGDGWYGYDPEQQIAFVPPEDSRHIARQDPARTLREVEAKRAVLAAYCAAVSAREEAARLVQKARTSGWDPIMAELEEASAIHKRDALHEVLRLLALPYSDHPGYEEALAGG